MIISVFGKNGAGKTSIATHLAHNLAQDNKFTSVVSLEMRYGSLQRSLGITVPDSKSIINVLTQDEVNSYFTIYEDNIYIASLANCDDITKYDAINNLAKDENILSSFMKKLKSSFDYSIVDLTELIIDPFTFFMIKNSDYLINVTESRPEGVAYANSHKDLISSVIDKNKVINVLNKHDEGIINLKTVKSLFDDIDVCIAFSLDDIKKERENKLSKNLLEKTKEIMLIIEKRNENAVFEEKTYKNNILKKLLRR